MSVLTNKHLVVALLVAPVLAVLAWYAIDSLVGERPQPAQAGQSYPLVEKPDCRYASGHCGLKNADVEVRLTADRLGDDRVSLLLTSVLPLDGAMIAVVSGADDDDAPPAAMTPRGEDGLTWSADLVRPESGRQRLRVVVSAAGSLYYGDAATAFILPEDSGKGGN